MSDNEDYDEGDDDQQMDEDEEYQYNEEENEEPYDEDNDDQPYQGNNYAPARVGLKFEGKLLDHLNVASKNAAYSVYRQLSEICLVDIGDSFYSAMITAKVKDQFVIASLEFPAVEPFFPQAPPTIILQSHFKHPNDRFNIIFNCHPSLLKARWNICTSIREIVEDMIEVAKVSVA